jgi:hypothetical protein
VHLPFVLSLSNKTPASKTFQSVSQSGALVLGYTHRDLSQHPKLVVAAPTHIILRVNKSCLASLLVAATPTDWLGFFVAVLLCRFFFLRLLRYKWSDGLPEFELRHSP